MTKIQKEMNNPLSPKRIQLNTKLSCAKIIRKRDPVLMKTSANLLMDSTKSTQQESVWEITTERKNVANFGKKESAHMALDAYFLTTRRKARGRRNFSD